MREVEVSYQQSAISNQPETGVARSAGPIGPAERAWLSTALSPCRMKDGRNLPALWGALLDCRYLLGEVRANQGGVGALGNSLAVGGDQAPIEQLADIPEPAFAVVAGDDGDHEAAVTAGGGGQA